MTTKMIEATSERLRVRVNAGWFVLVPSSILFMLGGFWCATMAFRAEIHLDGQSLQYHRWYFDCWPTVPVEIPTRNITEVVCRVPADSWLNTLEIEVTTVTNRYTLELLGTNGDRKSQIASELRETLKQSGATFQYSDVTSSPLVILSMVLFVAGGFVLNLGQTVHVTLDAVEQTATLRIRRWLWPVAKTFKRPLASLVLVEGFIATGKPHYGLSGFQVQLGFADSGNKREPNEFFNLAQHAYFSASSSASLAHLLHVWLQLHGSTSSSRRTLKRRPRSRYPESTS